MTKQFTIRGRLSVGYHGEAHDILLCGGEPLAEQFVDGVYDFGEGPVVTVSWSLSEEEFPDTEFELRLLHSLWGPQESDYGHRYSEITGYLWTDEELKCGGHDLIDILHPEAGKFMHMRVLLCEE